jgi:membrane protein DedA with SNARE-associated domain
MHTPLEILAEHGPSLLALNVFVDQLGVPVPAVPTLVVAGALARDGRLPGGLMIAVAVLAAVAADLVWFNVGRRHGGVALRFVCRVSLSPDACVRQTESLYARFGARALLFAKFIPGLSAVSTPLAGASGMPLPTFLLFDVTGALVWSGASMLAGALLHTQVDDTLAALESMGRGAASLVLIVLTLYLIWRVWERRRFARAFAMTRIEPDELAARLAEDDPPWIFDVRSEAARLRDRRAIPGAQPLSLDPRDAELVGISIEREVVLYCT